MRQETREGVQEWYVGFRRVFKLLLFIFAVDFIKEYLIEVNPETLIPNWALGVVGVIIWSILYAIPYDNVRLFRYKKLYGFFMSFSAAWLLADWSDFRSQFIIPFLGALV